MSEEATYDRKQGTGNREQGTVRKAGTNCSLSSVTYSLKWSGRPDLNWGPLGPEPSALPGYATPRKNEVTGNR